MTGQAKNPNSVIRLSLDGRTDGQRAMSKNDWGKDLIFAYQRDWSFCFDHNITICFLSPISEGLIEAEKFFRTCIDCSWVMSRIIGTKSPPWKLLLDPIYVSTLMIQVVIDQVVATHGWIGVGPAYQKLLFDTFQLDQHSNVILAVILKNSESLNPCCDTS